MKRALKKACGMLVPSLSPTNFPDLEIGRSMSRRQEIPPRKVKGPLLLIALGCLGALSFSRLDAATGGRVQRQSLDTGGGGGVSSSIDRVHPEAFRTTTWVEVDLPANQVTLKGLRVLTANRSWTLQVCGSTLDLSTCSTVVGPMGTAPGWKGDYQNETWTFPYLDKEGRLKLHLRVTPVGGDWMIFRIQTVARQ